MNLKFIYGKKGFSFLFVILFSTNLLLATNQTAERANSSLKGKVVESVHGKSLEFATVSLFAAKDSALIKGTITNRKGEFQMEQLRADNYFIKVEYLGYLPYNGNNFSINKDEKKSLSTAIQLKIDSKSISEVTVNGNREFARVELGKTVYHVSKSPVSDGGTINEVLSTIPKLSVNADGNIQFRGNSNVKILIDGKMSGMLGMNPSEVLGSMAASDVDRVELISTSSARYDASGAAGIINIILKKNRTKGFNGSVSANVGSKDKKSGMFSANLRTGKLNFFGNYIYKDDWAERDYQVDRSIFTNMTYLKEYADIDFGNRYHIGKLGMDYLINKNNTITVSATMRDILQNWNGNYKYERNSLLSSTMPNFTYRESAVDLDYSSWIYNGSYIHQFSKKGQSLSLDFAYTDNSADNSGRYNELDANKNVIGDSSFDFYKTGRKESVSQIDYVQPVGEKGKIETGYMLRTNKIDYEDQADLSTVFNYKEEVHGLYAMYTGKAGKLGYEIGLRAEYSDVSTNRNYSDDYLDLFPSLHISYDISDKKQFQLAYDRMIYRPNSGMLNPFQNLRDPENQRLGSQDIGAYYNHNLEASLSFDREKASYGITLYFNQYKNLINQFRSINADNNAIVSYGNFDSKVYSALEFEAATKLNSWWSFNGYVGGIYEKIKPGKNFKFNTSDMWEVEGKVTSIMNFKKWFKFQASFRYQSEILTAQGKYQNLYYVDLGFSKRVLKGKGSLSLTANDIFDTFRFKIHSSDPDFYNKEIQYRETRIVKLSFRYFFGKRYRVLRAKPKKSGMRHSELDI